MISRIGKDELGEKARETLLAKGVNTDHVQTDPDHPTGTVHVELDVRGVPGFTITEDVAWDYLTWNSELGILARRTDAVCFGSLAQRSSVSRATIQQFVAATPAPAIKVFDVNLRAPFISREIILESLELANVLKISDEELPEVAKLCGLRGSPESIITELRVRHSLDLVALTRGPKGALLAGNTQTSDFSGCSARVRDTVGAGDSFTATLIVGLLKKSDLDTINRHACEVAAFVCSQDGAVPDLPAGLGGG